MLPKLYSTIKTIHGTGLVLFVGASSFIAQYEGGRERTTWVCDKWEYVDGH